MGQCLNRRIDNMITIRKEVKAWQQSRNNKKAKINWQFRTDDARIKLKKLYPTILSWHDTRGNIDFTGTIHHSDKGSQYGDHSYLGMLANEHMLVSMGLRGQDNAYVERINGIMYCISCRLNEHTDGSRVISTIFFSMCCWSIRQK